jgi:histone H3/H4
MKKTEEMPTVVAVKMKKQEDKRSRKEKWDNYMEEQLKAEREKVAGYEELAKIHSSYISILLKRLEATKDKPITITSKDVKEALTKYEARAIPSTDGFRLYCEAIE